MSALLELKDFSVRRGDAVVVHEVSLALDAGQTLAVLGDNGAGKSSLLAGIMGLAPTSGGLRIAAQDATHLPTHRRVRLGLGYCPDHRGMFAAMTARETLAAACPEVGGRLGGRAAAVEHWLARFPELARRSEAPSWQLSGGEQQMLSLARALIGQPKILLLDEPSLSLAPGLRQRLAALLSEVVANGVALLLVEQDAGFAQSLSPRSIFLRRGRLEAR